MRITKTSEQVRPGPADENDYGGPDSDHRLKFSWELGSEDQGYGWFSRYW